MGEDARKLGMRCLAWIGAMLVAGAAWSQQVETSVPASQRVTINLSAGMPGQSSWRFQNTQDSTAFSTTAFDDSSWTSVGIPHGANYLYSFLNMTSGGGDGNLAGSHNWYRLHFTLPAQYANSKVLVEFEGAHTGAQVFINGTLLPGITSVAADAQAAHVVGFLPFIVDLTPYVHTDGTTPNVLAVDVARNASWFESPSFSGAFRFGQAEAGLFRPAIMFITNKVHIPSNIYSNQRTWGTYVGTLSEVPSTTSTAQASSAVVQVQTNVLNESTTPQVVTLTTQIVDATGTVVATAPPLVQTIQPTTTANLPSTAAPMFTQQITINNPTLWYPNNSVYGKPYMYRVYHVVSIDGVVVDSAQSPLGIRTITWDHNVPYFNGHAMMLWGGSGRYDYPGLGSSVPEEQQWRDLAQFAAAGGNVWRPGHSSTSEEFVNAADAYGVMITQPSGDGEEAFATPDADNSQLKKELHRDMIIRDRSHPSILAWESNNGTMAEPLGLALLQVNQTWDPINTRVAADRTPDPVNGYILGCTLEGCEVGIKQSYPNNPAFGSEYWGNGTARGLAYDYELAFVAPFVDNWRKSRQANAMGIAQWYFADTPGENGLYAEFQQYRGTAQETTYENSVRGLGASMVDINRFPKLLYYAYEAAWTPFALKPVVHLAHHWNRSYEASAPIQVNAFSNCPSVKLLVNGVQQGAVLTPNSWQSDTSANLTQSTTAIPMQASWTVNWVAGTVEADCLDQFGNVVASDKQTTAGAEAKIVLSVVPALTRPDGTAFAVTANGSDAAFVVAQVQDASGNWVPTAADTVTFAVTGPATYLGGTQQFVQTGSDTYSSAAGNSSNNYHAPGDPQLQFEGGMQKVALLSQFATGQVTVTATAPGLASGSISYTIAPVPNQLPAPTVPALVIEPASTAVTLGQPATLNVTATGGTAALTFQWYRNGVLIAGATSATYTTPATASGDDQSIYKVVVTDSLGNVASDPATLSVVPPAPVVITTQPLTQTAFVGQSLTLSATATGSPSLSYQWQKGGQPIAGATAATYATPVLTAADNGDSFNVVITNPVNSLASNPALLTVNPAVAPTITQQPASQSVLANDPVTFTVGASGSPPFTYQWQLNGVNLPGANDASYSVFQVQATNVGTYAVVVTNAAGGAPSGNATLTIAPPGVNVALNKPAVASTTQAGLDPSFVTDGDLTTRWGSDAGVDPSSITIDLGSVMPINTAILYWEAAFASQYKIQYSIDNNVFNDAVVNNSGGGGVEPLTFPTVQARWVRMLGEQRGSQYGYSLYEIQLYDIPQCGASTERYTIVNSSTVLDNASGLTWQRAETTYTGADAQGAQYTQPIAQQYCTAQNMRLPTQSEALGISGVNSATCAFPLPWSTWTSTIDPTDTNDAAFVTYAGQSSFQVAGNFPGGVVCTTGTAIPAPTITTQPAAQSVAVGATATFSVEAIGSGTLSYQWQKSGVTIAGATGASYTTPATVSTDNGNKYTVLVTNPGGTVPSNAAVLTVTGASCDAVPAAPTGLTAAVVSASKVSLGWNASVAGAACTLTYDIYRSTSAGFTPAVANQIASAQAGLAYGDTGLAAGTTYYYAIEAIDAVGNSVASSQASVATTAASAPAPDFTLAVAPTEVLVGPASTSTTTVTLTTTNGMTPTTAVTFACSGLPSGASCAFSPVTLDGQGHMTSTLTVAAAHSTPTAASGDGATPTRTAEAGTSTIQASTGLLTCALLMLPLFARRRRSWRRLGATGLALSMLASCGGGGGSGSSVKDTTSTITVTATAASVMHTATFTLDVDN